MEFYSPIFTHGSTGQIPGKINKQGRERRTVSLFDRRTPVLSPARDFVATLSYLPGDNPALRIGGGRSLSEINPDQVRRYADTGRLPASLLWKIVAGSPDRSAAASEKLDEKDPFSVKMRIAIGCQILSAAKTVASKTLLSNLS